MASQDNVRIGFVGAGTLGRGLALALDAVGCECGRRVQPHAGQRGMAGGTG